MRSLQKKNWIPGVHTNLCFIVCFPMWSVLAVPHRNIFSILQRDLFSSGFPKLNFVSSLAATTFVGCSVKSKTQKSKVEFLLSNQQMRSEDAESEDTKFTHCFSRLCPVSFFGHNRCHYVYDLYTKRLLARGQIQARLPQGWHWHITTIINDS